MGSMFNREKGTCTTTLDYKSNTPHKKKVFKIKLLETYQEIQTL